MLNLSFFKTSLSALLLIVKNALALQFDAERAGACCAAEAAMATHVRLLAFPLIQAKPGRAGHPVYLFLAAQHPECPRRKVTSARRGFHDTPCLNSDAPHYSRAVGGRLIHAQRVAEVSEQRAAEAAGKVAKGKKPPVLIITLRSGSSLMGNRCAR